MKRLTIVLVLLLSTQVCAGDIWFQAYAGKSTYMKDSNPGRLRFNSTGLPGDDWDIAAITNGMNFAFEIGRDLDSKPGAIGLAFESLSGEDNISFDGGGELDFRIPAIAVRFFMLGDVPWLSSGRSNFSIGGSIGFLKTQGDIKIRYERPDPLGVLEAVEEANDFSSTDLYLDLFIVDRFDFSDKLGLVAQIGYRGAPAADTTIATEGMRGDLRIDYSSLYYRMGLRFAP